MALEKDSKDKYGKNDGSMMGREACQKEEK